MDKTKSYKVPVIFYLLSLLESAAGLTGLYFSYPAAAYIVLFLLLLNPLFIQLFSVRPYVKKQMSQPYISVEYQNRLSDFEEKFNTLSQNHKTLSEKIQRCAKNFPPRNNCLQMHHCYTNVRSTPPCLFLLMVHCRRILRITKTISNVLTCLQLSITKPITVLPCSHRVHLH